MVDFSHVLESFPDYKEYLSVDELNASSQQLAKEYPDKVKLIDLGKSGNGESIWCLKIGEGRYKALIHGFPNPEEPFGGVILDYFSRVLAEDDKLREELGYTWYLIKCSDPDGARPNEGFLRGPHTPMNFTLNYYRTPHNLTGEMCFPYRYGPLDLNKPVPETLALMKLMDAIHFDFVSSLHMMKWGGITYEVPGPCPSLYPALYEVAKRLHIFPRKRLGTTIAPGIQQADYLTPARNWVKAKAAGKEALEEIAGCYIYEYGLVRNPKLFMMVPECCIWYDPRMWNDELGEATVGELVKYGKEVGGEVNGFMLGTWEGVEPLLGSPSIFRTMMEERMRPVKRAATIVSDPDPVFDDKAMSRKATVAEEIGVKGRADLYRMFYLGGMIRAFDHELENGGNSKLEAAKVEVMEKIKEYDGFLHKNYQVKAHPIRNLGGMSLGAILHSTEYVKWKSPWRY